MSTDMRTRTALATATVVLGCAASFYLFASACPGTVYGLYVEAVRWFKAAGPPADLPVVSARPRDAVPCRGTLHSAKYVNPADYFPLTVLSCDERLDEMLRDWYTKQLAALGEPALWPLSQKDSRARVFRFLWLRTFHAPVAVRVVLRDDLTGTVYLKTSSGAGGFKPGTLTRNEAFPVGKQRTTLLLTRLVEANFWDLPSEGPVGGTDGAQWVFEAIDEGHYHVVDRWSPGEPDPLHTLGLTFLIDVADMRFDDHDIY